MEKIFFYFGPRVQWFRVSGVVFCFGRLSTDTDTMSQLEACALFVPAARVLDFRALDVKKAPTD